MSKSQIGTAEEMAAMRAALGPKCLCCFRQFTSRIKKVKLAPPPPRKHMNIAPFSTSGFVQPQLFCRPCARDAQRNGWIVIVETRP